MCMTSTEKIKQICKDRDIPMSKLEKDCGFANGYIGRLKKGVLPSDRLVTVANYLDIPVDSLNPDDTPKPKNTIRVFHALEASSGERFSPTDLFSDIVNARSIRVTKRIPVLGRVAAGLPIEAQQEILDWEEITGEMALDGEYFALQIRGDSMEPKFSNGDVVIVRQQEDADDGDIVIALVNGNDAVCKRLRKYRDGIVLMSSNPAYEPMYFSGKEVTDTPVKIIGKVKELRAKF